METSDTVNFDVSISGCLIPLSTQDKINYVNEQQFEYYQHPIYSGTNCLGFTYYPYPCHYGFMTDPALSPASSDCSTTSSQYISPSPALSPELSDCSTISRQHLSSRSCRSTPLRTVKLRKRTVFKKEQLDFLNDYYESNPHPTVIEKVDIAKRLKLTKNQVKNWFQNRRKRTNIKNKSENAYVTRLESLLLEIRMLQELSCEEISSVLGES